MSSIFCRSFADRLFLLYAGDSESGDVAVEVSFVSLGSEMVDEAVAIGCR
jgi:hypothetical protein